MLEPEASTDLGETKHTKSPGLGMGHNLHVPGTWPAVWCEPVLSNEVHSIAFHHNFELLGFKFQKNRSQ